MKKYAIIATVLVLTLSLLTGCGCTAKDSGMATMPSTGDTLLPTNIPETTVPTEPATMPSTTPATAPTRCVRGKQAYRLARSIAALPIGRGWYVSPS